MEHLEPFRFTNKSNDKKIWGKKIELGIGNYVFALHLFAMEHLVAHDEKAVC